MIGGPNEAAIEGRVGAGQTDLEQVGPGLGEAVELAALDIRMMNASGDEHPERAAGLGEDRVEAGGGCQDVSFSVEGPSQVSGDGRPTGRT